MTGPTPKSDSQPSGEASRFVLSRKLNTLPIGSRWTVVSHGLHLRRLLLDADIYRRLQAFAEPGLTRREFEGSEPARTKELRAAFNLFEQNHLILPAGQDEDELLASMIEKQVLEKNFSQVALWRPLLPCTLAGLSSAKESPKALKVVLFGGCLAQLAQESIRSVGREYGFDVQLSLRWPTKAEASAALDADMVILQAGITEVLSPLWDRFAFLDGPERIKRLGIIKSFLTDTIQKLAGALKGGVLLVHGICGPQWPPFGRSEFRIKPNLGDIVREVNEHISGILAENLNAVFIDEERIVSNEGKAYLMDDMVNVYGHHGPIDFLDHWTGSSSGLGKGLRDPARPHVSELFAREYFDCYLMWKGIERVKCVVVDLDNTLWRGVVGETRPTISDVYSGIHQALKILKARGVLLATCSRNNRDDVMEFWSRPQNRDGSLLSPDDFVLHMINWERKSANIAVILGRLGLVPESVVFIDDNPVERAEVRAAHPAIRVLGEDMAKVRSILLQDPRFQPNALSAESARRSEMTAAQLRRDDALREAVDEDSFLRSIGVELRIAKIASRRHLARLVEIFERTNQFNTTLMRFDSQALLDLVAREDSSLYAIEIQDRFTNYGIVGACAISRNEIQSVVMSCRVLALQPWVPFISKVISEAGLNRAGTLGLTVKGPRNEPALGLFIQLGFKPLHDGKFILENPIQTPPKEGVYKIRIVDESDLAGD